MNDLRDTRIDLSQSWGPLNSSDRQLVNYSRSALVIIPTPVRLDSKEFVEFWKRSSDYLPRFGVSPLTVSASTEASFNTTTTATSIKANRYSCYLYDAVMLWATALHEVMTEGNVTA